MRGPECIRRKQGPQRGRNLGKAGLLERQGKAQDQTYQFVKRPWHLGAGLMSKSGPSAAHNKNDICGYIINIVYCSSGKRFLAFGAKN